jgi:hypothetical protein
MTAHTTHTSAPPATSRATAARFLAAIAGDAGAAELLELRYRLDDRQRMGQVYNAALAEHHLAAQRDRGGHCPAHLPAPLGDKRSADTPAQDSARQQPRADGSNPSSDRRLPAVEGADPGAVQLLLEDL